MKKLLITMLILVFFVEIEAQKKDYQDLELILNSKEFLFLDSLAVHSYRLNFGDPKTENALYRNLDAFLKENQSLLNVKPLQDQGNVFELSIEEFNSLCLNNPVGFQSYSGKTPILAHIVKYKQEMFKKRFKKALFYSNSENSRLEYSFMYNNDKFVSHYRNVDCSRTRSSLTIYGGSYLIEKNHFMVVELDHAIYGNSLGTTEYIVKPDAYSGQVYPEALSGIKSNSEFGTVEFSFTRLWYWIHNNKVYLQFDKSVNSSPLTTVIRGGNKKALQAMIANGADIHNKDYQGRNLILQAIALKHSALVPYLMEKGVSIEERDNEGYTALLLSIESKNNSLTEYLLEHKADYKAKTNENVSAFKMAFRNPRYQNNLLHMYRPVRPGFRLIDFAFAGDVFNANNSGTYTAKMGPMICQRLNQKMNIRHELNLAWSQMDLAAKYGELMMMPDGSFTSLNPVNFTQLVYAPMFRYMKIPEYGVFMQYFAAGPEFSFTLNKEEEIEGSVKNGNMGINLAGGIEAYNNRFGFMMEAGLSRDITGMLDGFDMKRTLFHVSMGFMF